jgi:hypothetical protein
MGTAPDLFELGQAGYARVKRQATAKDWALLQESADGCPNQAILVEVADGEEAGSESTVLMRPDDGD